jgi:hypothetical protein
LQEKRETQLQFTRTETYYWVYCHEKDESPRVVKKTTGLAKDTQQKCVSYPFGVHPLS